MADITLTIGPVTAKITADNAKAQAMIENFLAERAYVDLPDPETETLVRTELTAQQKADLFLRLLIEDAVAGARRNHIQAERQRTEETAREQAKAIQWK